MQKEELHRGKTNRLREIFTVLFQADMRRGETVCQGQRKGGCKESDYELTHGPEWGFWQGGDGDFSRVGEYERPCSWSGKPRAVIVLGSSPGAGSKLSESKQWPGYWQEGWEAGGSQQSKICWGGFLGVVGREVKNFNWNKAGLKTMYIPEDIGGKSVAGEVA